MRFIESGAAAPTSGARVAAATGTESRIGSAAASISSVQSPGRSKRTVATWNPRTSSGNRANSATAATGSPPPGGCAETAADGVSTKPSGPSIAIETRCVPTPRSGVPSETT